MPGFFSLPRECLMPFCDVSSTHCSEGRAESVGADEAQRQYP